MASLVTETLVFPEEVDNFNILPDAPCGVPPPAITLPAKVALPLLSRVKLADPAVFKNE